MKRFRVIFEKYEYEITATSNVEAVSNINADYFTGANGKLLSVQEIEVPTQLVNAPTIKLPRR